MVKQTTQHTSPLCIQHTKELQGLEAATLVAVTAAAAVVVVVVVEAAAENQADRAHIPSIAIHVRTAPEKQQLMKGTETTRTSPQTHSPLCIRSKCRMSEGRTKCTATQDWNHQKDMPHSIRKEQGERNQQPKKRTLPRRLLNGQRRGVR